MCQLRLYIAVFSCSFSEVGFVSKIGLVTAVCYASGFFGPADFNDAVYRGIANNTQASNRRRY